MWQGKHIMVTGAARGIGKAVALHLGKLGCVVSGFDRLEDELNDLAKEFPNKCYFKQIDITNYNHCKQFVWEANQRLGKIDGIINCAGITRIQKAVDTEIEDFEKIIAVNLMGTINIVQLCLTDIIKQKGFIVGIASIAGYSPLYYRTAYAASKHGVMGYLGSLRAELAEENVRVITVCPGYVATKLQENEPQFSNRTGEAMTPEYIATEIIKGIESDTPLVLIGSVARKTYWMHKLFPKWYQKIMVSKTK